MLRLFVGICIYYAYITQANGAITPRSNLQVILPDRSFHDVVSYEKDSKETYVNRSDVHLRSLNLMTHLKIQGLQGGVSVAPLQQEGNTISIQKGKRILKVFSGTAIILVISFVIYDNKETLFNGEKFQQALLSKLSEMKDRGVSGLIFYSLGLCLWESLGLTTVPIETVAGMTFNFYQAVIASVVGKVSGALLAFLIGRFWLAHVVRERLAGNDTLNLVENSIAHKPFRSSLCMKYACFPEIVKNLSLSIMPPVSILTFLLATCTHGIPYTILWNFLGKDAAMRLRSSDPLPPNRLLSAVLIATTVFGFVGSPAIVAIWIKDMQQFQKKTCL